MAHENDWVADKTQSEPDTWSQKTWSGLRSIDGNKVWTDGKDIYYSNNNQYVLNRQTSTWETKNWGSREPYYGHNVWTDGDNIYFSSGSTQYILDKENMVWNKKTWNGLNSFYGLDVWTDGTDYYYSRGDSHYLLSKATSTWSVITWSGLTSFDGSGVWTDGENTYYSYGSNKQYVLNKETSTWIYKNWSGGTPTAASYVWTDNENVYYSGSGANYQYVLDKQTSTWKPKVWNGLTSFTGDCVWLDGNHVYYSSGTAQYRLKKPTSVPYRLSFPELKKSIDPHNSWLMDDDIPYRMDFPELKESLNIDSWVTHKIPDPSTDGLRFLKLSYNLTVNWEGNGTNNITVSTDIPEAFKVPNHLYINSSMSYHEVWMVINTEIPQCPYQCRMTFDDGAVELLDSLNFIGPRFYVFRSSGASAQLAFNPSALEEDLYSESIKNTGLRDDRQYLSSPYNYACEARVVFNHGSGGAFPQTPGTVNVAVDIIFAFDASQTDRYNDLLSRYPDHVTSFEYTKNAVPYRLAFPEIVESIDITDKWLILDDIPFRLNFPPLIPTNTPSDSWLQDKGWDPRRPWPDHRSIIQKVQTIPNIPDVDWTKSMQQTFEFYTVDPNSWYDDQKLENIISCDLTHDLTSDKRGNASITVTEPLPECYIRTYLVVTQAGHMHKICLGTYLYMTSSDSFDGMKHNITMTGYTPMVELEEKLPPLGFHIVGITNRKHSSDAPMVTDAIKDIVTTYTRCEIENRTVIQKPLLNDFVAGSNDNFLTVINNVLNASSLQQYILTVDEWGTIIVKDKPVLEDAIPTYIYTDDNSSILLPSLDTNDDIYGIPNVVEVLYTGDKRLPAIRVIVKNEDPTSIVSIPSRGREIAKRFTITNIAAPVNDYSEAAVRAQVTAQAERLLEAASTINKTISYSHGYCDVKVGDTVLINYERAGVTGIRAKVVSQRISCKPGCQVDEQAVYTKKLWNRGV